MPLFLGTHVLIRQDLFGTEELNPDAVLSASTQTRQSAFHTYSTACSSSGLRVRSVVTVVATRSVGDASSVKFGAAVTVIVVFSVIFRIGMRLGVEFEGDATGDTTFELHCRANTRC